MGVHWARFYGLAELHNFKFLHQALVKMQYVCRRRQLFATVYTVFKLGRTRRRVPQICFEKL